MPRDFLDALGVLMSCRSGPLFFLVRPLRFQLSDVIDADVRGVSSRWGGLREGNFVCEM